MKRQLPLAILLAAITVTVQAQTIRATIGPGTSANKVRIYLRSDATQTPTTISTLQFNLAIPNTVTPRPTAVAVSTPTFTGVTWQITTEDNGGYYNYNI